MDADKSEPTMPSALDVEELMRRWDPLEALEAEYAAVLAQSIPKPDANERTDSSSELAQNGDENDEGRDLGDYQEAASDVDDQAEEEAREQSTQQHRDAPTGYVEFVDQEELEQEEDQDGNYALLPSSPVGSSDEEHNVQFDEAQRRPEEAVRLVQEDDEEEEGERVHELPAVGLAAAATMAPEQKQNVMKSMSQVHIKPPQWAQTMDLSDDQLNEWVWRRLLAKGPTVTAAAPDGQAAGNGMLDLNLRRHEREQSPP